MFDMSLFFLLFVFLAVSDYRKAESTEEGANSKRVQDGIQRAQKLLKQSQKRDYYKILGIKR